MYHLLHYTFITSGDVITEMEKTVCLVVNVVCVLVLSIALALLCSGHVTPPSESGYFLHIGPINTVI